MPLLNPGARRPLSPRERESFSGTPQPLTLHGPCSLYRLLGTWRDVATGRKGRSDPPGVFWFDVEVIALLKEGFLGMIEAQLMGERAGFFATSALRAIRDGLAVSKEWNSFDSLLRLTLDRSGRLELWSGVTAWQLAIR